VRLYGKFGFGPEPELHPKDVGQEFFSVPAAALCKRIASVTGEIFPLKDWQIVNLDNQRPANKGTVMDLEGLRLTRIPLEHLLEEPELFPTNRQGSARGWSIHVQKMFQDEITKKRRPFEGVARWDSVVGFYHVVYDDGDTEHLDAAAILDIMSLDRAPVYKDV
jgi:hypothetical protein